MANLSNINNKFLFTDGDFLKIGNLAPINNISGTESGISITNGNCASITLDNSAAQGKTFSIYSAVNGSLNFYDVDANSGRLIIDSSGNATFAGNVTLSDGKMQISGPALTDNYLKINVANVPLQNGVLINYAGASQSTGLFINQPNGGGSGAADYALLKVNNQGANPTFYSSNNGSTPVIIKANGNVGIGTNSPLHNLQIGTAATNGSYSMMIEGNFANTALSSNPRLNLIDTNFGITAGKYGSGGSDDALGIFAYQGTGRGILFAHTTAGSTTTLQNMRHDMFIDGGTGHVGIGTTSPSKKLEVAGSYKLGTNAYIQYDAGYPYTINMLNTAAVGNLILNAGAGSSGYESKIELQGSNTAGAAGITLSTAGSTRMVITADGKIGLDKSDPFYSVDATSFGAATHEWGSGLSVFGQDRYSIRELNNLFYSADTRVGGIGTSSNVVNTMFDGNFDTGHGIAANTTYVVELDGSGAWNMTYPSGYAIISFYYVYNNFTSIVGEQYHYSGTYAGQWRTMGTATTIRGSAGGGGRVVRINSVGNNYVSKWRFTFVTGSTSITVTDIAFYTTRTAGAPVSAYMRGDRTNEWTRMIRFRNDAYGIVGSINPGNTSTTFNTTSDYRLKEDLKDFKGLDMVSKIPVYDFRWINSEKRSYGVLAHELNEIYPEAVEGEKDEKENQCVDYSKIVPLLVKSIQELKAGNDSLKARIETLENN